MQTLHHQRGHQNLQAQALNKAPHGSHGQIANGHHQQSL